MYLSINLICFRNQCRELLLESEIIKCNAENLRLIKLQKTFFLTHRLIEVKECKATRHHLGRET